MTDDDLPTADDVRGILKSDIIERLRDPLGRVMPTMALREEAAEEIERLRGLLREAIPYIEGAQNTTSVDALLATEELLKRVRGDD